MLSTLRAIVRNGKIELLEPITLPEGVELLVTVLTEDSPGFWYASSETSLNRIWDNAEDDIYMEQLVQCIRARTLRPASIQESDLIAMAHDPAIQRELHQSATEFAETEADGLVEDI